jgi:peptidoglycan/LPS O-acetylase OafA/YrhL
MIKYRPEIDGLRAIAVLPVVLYHAKIPFFSGGFVGVDVFFVISGFLITQVILRALEQDNFSILHFYERRIRRIIPALTAIMLACTGQHGFSISQVTLRILAKAFLPQSSSPPIFSFGPSQGILPRRPNKAFVAHMVTGD